MTLQRRISLIAFLLSLITAVANFITSYRPDSWFNIYLCIGLMVVFSITIAWESYPSKILQIVTFIVAAFICLKYGSNKMIGTSILIIEILILYSYGFFKKNLYIKILISALMILALLFVTIPQTNEAFMVFVFVTFITASIFMILYDMLEKAYHALDDSLDFATKAMQMIERITKNGK